MKRLTLCPTVCGLSKERKMDKCETCRYNTNDYVCHPHCSGCDGQSKYEPKHTQKGGENREHAKERSSK